jgi:hypothetical protein
MQFVDSPPPPSRRDNPFATCWTKPGALPFRFPDCQSAEQLVAKLAGHNWWGQITGTHGSGKTSLLAALIPALTAAGRRVHELRFHDSTGRLVCDAKEMKGAQSLVVIDGFEQLGCFARMRLKRQCRRAGAGLLVTSHVSAGLPTLVHLSPERRLIEQLVADLCAQVPGCSFKTVGDCPNFSESSRKNGTVPLSANGFETASSEITGDDVAASYASHGSNVREIFFDLYDRHERTRRKNRTAASAPP